MEKGIIKPLLLMGFATAFLISSFFQGGTPLEEYKTITIDQGDTLMAIAEEHATQTNKSPEEFMHWVADTNDVEPRLLKVGTELVLPIKKDHSQVNLVAKK